MRLPLAFYSKFRYIVLIAKSNSAHATKDDDKMIIQWDNINGITRLQSLNKIDFGGDTCEMTSECDVFDALKTGGIGFAIISEETAEKIHKEYGIH